MIELPTQRLASTHLEDAIFLILSARPDGRAFELYPDLDDEMRGRLRSRLKQIARYDWPSSQREDPALRRGYTLHQCFRLMISLQLLDAHLPPALAIAIVQNNEQGFLRAIAARLREPTRFDGAPSDLIAVVSPAEIQDAFGFPGWSDFQAERVHFLPRHALSKIWSDDLAGAGARLAIDIGSAAIRLWRWISGRRLMHDTVRITFLDFVGKENSEATFQRVAERRLRR